MAFRRSPVRSRSGPPPFARLHPCASYGWQATLRESFWRRSLPNASARLRQSKGVHRSAKREGGLPDSATCPPTGMSARRRILHPAGRVGSARSAHLMSTLATLLENPAAFAGLHFALGNLMQPPKRFVYVLKSESESSRYYTGVTSNVRARLTAHNEGRCPHTSRWTPWRVIVVVAFAREKRALEFERYLKSGSGCAFAARHFK